MTTALQILKDNKNQNFLKEITNYPVVKNILNLPHKKTLIDEIIYRNDNYKIEKIISRIIETNEIIKITNFDYFNDKKIKSIEEFSNSRKFRETTFSLFKSVTEYDVTGEKKLRTINFNLQNSNKKASTYEYDLKSGKIVKMIIYRPDGENIAFIKEISPITGLVTRCINYKLNSQAISSVAKYDFIGNTTIKTIYYYNSPIHINNIDNIDKKLISDDLNKRIISNPKNEKINKLLDNLYKNKLNFNSINKS